VTVGAAAYWWHLWRTSPGYIDPETEPDFTDIAEATMLNAANFLARTDASQMAPSAAVVVMLKAGEGLSLKRYELGDGGYTIGYGRYFPYGKAVPPEVITREKAEEWFAEDVDTKAARWVRAYVTVPLVQHEFDALTHMAFSLSPKSFKTIAQAVNEGRDPEAAAMQFIRAGSNLERGLRNRRAREINLYRNGVYA